MPRAWKEVGTPGHSVSTQLDHPHKNKSLNRGSPLSEFISTYHSQELSTFTLDFHTCILGSVVLCPTLSYGKFSVVRGKRIPMHLMGSLPEKKLENCPCIISLSLASHSNAHNATNCAQQAQDRETPSGSMPDTPSQHVCWKASRPH